MGGRSLPSYVIVFTQFATLVGGGVLVGHVSIGFSYGLAPLAYGVCGAVIALRRADASRILIH